MSEPKRILISYGRNPITLDFIRNLSSLDHQIYLAETQKWNLSSFSNKVTKNFVVPSPRFQPEQHIAALIDIIQNEKIDLFIPLWEDIFLVSKNLDRFPSFCKVFSSHFSLLHRMHNKWDFVSLLNELGIDSLKTVHITNKRDLGQVDLPCYALKACYSRASQNVYRITDKTPYPTILPSEKNPWIAQEWCEGEHFCSYSICHEGKIHAHAVYPADFIMNKGGKHASTVESYCMTFSSVDKPEILEWVQNFVTKTNFSGQIAFDFVQMENGKLYAIECNPRTTSGITLFEPEDHIDQAFLAKNETIIQPKLNKQKHIAIGNLLYGWQRAIGCKKLPQFFQNFYNSEDVIFHRGDMKPFLAQPLVWVLHVYDGIRLQKSLPAAFTHDLDYNGER